MGHSESYSRAYAVLKLHYGRYFEGGDVNRAGKRLCGCLRGNFGHNTTLEDPCPERGTVWLQWRRTHSMFRIEPRAAALFHSDDMQRVST